MPIECEGGVVFVCDHCKKKNELEPDQKTIKDLIMPSAENTEFFSTPAGWLAEVQFETGASRVMCPACRNVGVA